MKSDYIYIITKPNSNDNVCAESSQLFKYQIAIKWEWMILKFKYSKLYYPILKLVNQILFANCYK